MERVMGIEPTQPAWKAGILPLNYTRTCQRLYILPKFKKKVKCFFDFFPTFFGNFFVFFRRRKFSSDGGRSEGDSIVSFRFLSD